MASIFNNFFQQLGQGDTVKDFKHASRLFVDDNYALSPKYTWLYHVFFDLNPELSQIKNTNRLAEHGMLVKSVELPKFAVNNRVLNEYNRPNIVQTKVSMEQVQIVFHDDQSNVIRDLWYDYYSYYYRDVDIGYMNNSGLINPVYFSPSKYAGGPRDQLNRFGFTPRAYDSRGETQYIQAIRIYSLHQKKFSEYTLVNPCITSFRHGRHESAPGADSMDHTMTISYETVLYASGYITKNTVKGFADLHYDKSPSPLTPQGGGTNSIMGPGGILDAASTIFQQGTAGTATGIGAAAFTLFKAVEKNKNIDLRNLAKTELIQAGKDILQGQNPLDRAFFPSQGSGSVISFPQFAQAPQSPSAASGSVTSNGQSVNSASGATSLVNSSGFGAAATISKAAVSAATPLVGGPFTGVYSVSNISENISGAVSTPTNTLAGGSLNTVYNVNKLGDVIGATPQTGADFYGAALQKFQTDTRSQVQSTIEQSTLNVDLPAGFTSQLAIPSGVKVFSTGTGSVVNATNILGLAPGSGGIIPASPEVISKAAQNFIENGNPFSLTPADNAERLGLSTPPIG